MRALPSKDLLSHFKNVEETANGINKSSLKQMLINNHTEPNRGKIKGHLPLEQILGFCKTFKKITNNLFFHLTFRTNYLQDILFKTLANDISVTINSLHLFVLKKIPNTETEVMFNESFRNIYTTTFDSWYTERELSTDGNELQVDSGSAQHNNSPKYLIPTFQTASRTLTPNKQNNVAIFDNVKGKKNIFAK